MFCEFAGVCDTQWREEDSLFFVAGLTSGDREVLEAAGVETLGALATSSSEVDDIRPDRMERLTTQAALQVEARAEPDLRPPFLPIAAGTDPTWGRGLELLPEPDAGDIFLDFEGDPFWTTERGLFFLFGFIARGPEGTWTYQAIWAHDRREEERATGELIELLAHRRASQPNMHVYHYNHTERTALERLALDHGVGEAELSEMIATGLFVDLYRVALNAVQVGTESYGLKDLERLTGYERGHEIEQGAAAVVEYEKYMAAPDPGILEQIAAYNEDDVRATLALRDWLVELRPDGLPWRAARLEPEEDYPELDVRVGALHAFGPGTPEHLLGDLLGYWVREFRAHKAPKLARLGAETQELLDDPDVLAGLEFLGMETRHGVNGKELTPGARFHLPEQAVSGELGRAGASVLYGTPDGPTGYTTICEFDEANGEVVLLWGDRPRSSAWCPRPSPTTTGCRRNRSPKRSTALPVPSSATPGPAAPIRRR